MQTPDGKPTNDSAKTENTTVNGLKVTLLDVSGTYTGSDMGGGGTSQSKPNYRMRAGVIDTPKGAYFIKLVGPEKTVARWDQSFHDFVRSAEFKGLPLLNTKFVTADQDLVSCLNANALAGSYFTVIINYNRIGALAGYLIFVSALR